MIFVRRLPRRGTSGEREAGRSRRNRAFGALVSGGWGEHRRDIGRLVTAEIVGTPAPRELRPLSGRACRRDRRELDLDQIPRLDAALRNTLAMRPAPRRRGGASSSVPTGRARVGRSPARSGGARRCDLHEPRRLDALPRCLDRSRMPGRRGAPRPALGPGRPRRGGHRRRPGLPRSIRVRRVVGGERWPGGIGPRMGGGCCRFVRSAAESVGAGHTGRRSGQALVRPRSDAKASEQR